MNDSALDREVLGASFEPYTVACSYDQQNLFKNLSKSDLITFFLAFFLAKKCKISRKTFRAINFCRTEMLSI